MCRDWGQVAFPFASGVLEFYKCWMSRGDDGVWTNTKDQSHECNPAGPACYQSNAIIANGFIRRVASALPGMAADLGEPEDPAWADITVKMVPLPTAPHKGGSVFVLAGSYDATSAAATGNKTGAGPKCLPDYCGTLGCPPCAAQPPGSMDVATWPIWPAEVINLASPPSVLATAHATLTSSAPWLQVRADRAHRPWPCRSRSCRP